VLAERQRHGRIAWALATSIGFYDRLVGDADLLATIRKTFPVVSRWRVVLASQIDVGGELAEDDLAWQWLPSSTLAMVGLGAAREHLHAIRLLIDAGELFPSATSTLARSGLIGASQAVWILRPDDRRERLRRALSLARHDYVQHQKFGRYVTESFPAEQTHRSAREQMSRLKMRVEQVDALLADLGGAYRIDMTNVVLRDAVDVFADPAVRAQVRGRWQQVSGSVHGLAWQHFGQEGTEVAELSADGIGLVTIGGDIAQLAVDYFCVFHLASAAWKLFARRAGQPSLAVEWTYATST
jgi:hypothetical protein